MSDVKKPPKAENKPLQTPAPGSDADSVKKLLDEQPKESIRLYQIPADSSDDPLDDVPVGINGYIFQIKRGVSLKVPESVAEILRHAGHI